MSKGIFESVIGKLHNCYFGYVRVCVYDSQADTSIASLCFEYFREEEERDMNMNYETERLILQVLPPYENEQVLRFYQDNREHLEHWEAAREKNFYTAQYQRALLEAEFDQIVKSRMLRFYLYEKENPEQIIGSVCANNIRHGAFQNCNVGYKIHRDFCRKGYGKEAMKKLLAILHKEYYMHRVEAMVHPDNTASVALLESLDFQREGLSRHAALLQGGWQDMYRYGYVFMVDK